MVEHKPALVYDDPETYEHMRGKKDLASELVKHMSLERAMFSNLQQVAVAAPPPPAPATAPQQHHDQNLIQAVQALRDQLAAVRELSGRLGVTAALPISGMNLKRQDLCQHCGMLGHGTSRSCPIFHGVFQPARGKDYLTHYNSFFNADMEKCGSEAERFLDRVDLYLQALATPQANASPLKNRDIFNWDGKLLDRQKLHTDDKATTRKDKKACISLDGEDNMHNRIRSEFQRRFRNVSITCWFGAPFSYLYEMVAREEKPSSYLDMVSFTDPVEMHEIERKWRDEHYHTGDMKMFIEQMNTPVAYVPGSAPMSATAVMHLFKSEINANTTGEDKKMVLSDRGIALRDARAEFFDQLIYACIFAQSGIERITDWQFMEILSPENLTVRSLATPTPSPANMRRRTVAAATPPRRRRAPLRRAALTMSSDDEEEEHGASEGSLSSVARPLGGEIEESDFPLPNYHQQPQQQQQQQQQQQLLAPLPSPSHPFGGGFSPMPDFMGMSSIGMPYPGTSTPGFSSAWSLVTPRRVPGQNPNDIDFSGGFI